MLTVYRNTKNYIMQPKCTLISANSNISICNQKIKTCWLLQVFFKNLDSTAVSVDNKSSGLNIPFWTCLKSPNKNIENPKKLIYWKGYIRQKCLLLFQHFITLLLELIVQLTKLISTINFLF